ncbi:hypothetical protein O9G_006216 [Rozella allomycis CSF55]|uniref:Uncharacterized protein n=1 Tax=Rozella allomycis (strain CSF55) TaxID=988480 RepID=A0A075B4W2_ROZAC|nr:hypothetical protein O9G_006216 [Rozella allomycis CSF55]|eukprot:EPZ36686.1 hypothetical protein O9G_006216 [Rozella allomycis CSF55]
MVANEDNDQDIEDEDLSDSEMFQFDQQLANIFSEKKRLKKESKEVLKQSTHFKFRILDFISILIKKSHPLVPNFILPLMNLLRKFLNSKNDEIHNLALKIKFILENHLFKLKFDNLDSNSLTDFTQSSLLKPKVHDSSLYTTCLHSLLVFIFKNSNDKSSILDFIKSALDDFMNNKNSNISPCLFHTFIERFPSNLQILIPDVLKFSSLDSNRKHFKTIKAWNFLTC